MLTAMHSTQITGRKRDRASSEDSSDDELVAPELLDPAAGVQRKKARLGFKGCQWIAVFGERNSMKQRCSWPQLHAAAVGPLGLISAQLLPAERTLPCRHLWKSMRP